MADDEIRAWLILLRAPGIGPATLRGLIERAGNARDACAQARRLRGELALSHDAIVWIESPDTARISADLAWFGQPDHRLLCFTDAGFPPQLGQIAQPPAALFVAGDPALLLSAQIAVVGARSASSQGLANARDFAKHFARAGLTITCGLADGIDGAAHAGALDAKGATVAVIGTGADLVYPRKHRELTAKITEQGAIVSEYPLGTPALPAHFPQRNRLIAARLAAEAGREVFALPGSIHNPLARGCHRLIRDGARLVETSGEVIEALSNAARSLGAELRARLDAPASDAEDAPPTGGDRHADPDYARLLTALDEAPTALNELVARTNLSPAALSSMLLLLELEGAVAPAVNGRWQRLF